MPRTEDTIALHDFNSVVENTLCALDDRSWQADLTIVRLVAAMQSIAQLVL